MSNSLDPTIGFYVTNNTGSTITSLTINYTGEQWRLGATGRTDRIDFQYSQDATSLITGTWVDVDALDFTAPVTTGGTGALNGNLAANRTNVSSTISGLYIPDGTNFFIRWTDFNPTGSDDGLGIDDFNLTAGFTAASPHYFRTVQTGLWTNISTWESSPDNISWAPATEIPNAASNTVSIKSGHTVTFAAFLPLDQIVIESGGVLDFTTGIMVVLDDISGDDIDIQSGGVFVLSSASNPPVFASGTATVNVNSGGILRVSAAGLTSPAGTGVHLSNFVYQHQSIMEYTFNGGFGSDNVVFFPNANAATIPIFKTSNTSVMLVGATNPTTFNGVFENNGIGGITWQNSGNKIFRNGIRGTGNITANASAANAKFIINGTTAELGGTGSLTVPTTGGLETGPTTTVTMSSNKTVTGNISLLANSYVQLGAFDLTVTGSIAGGSTTSYIKTNGTGSLILNNITALRDAPIGNSSYNPLKITNANGYNWTLRVEDVLIVDDPVFASNTAKAVQREWHITPSTTPTASGTDIVFQYNDDPLALPRETGLLYNTGENVQVWREVNLVSPYGNDWIAVNVAQVPTGSPDGIRTASITNWTQFSPFAISNISAPLPIKLLQFNAIKINSGLANLNWELAACCAATAKFEVERSTDGRTYAVFTTIPGSTTSRFYQLNDSRLSKGITYYRLKMTDEDGKITYSKVAVIINDNTGLLITSLAPNPAQDKTVVSITAAKPGTVSFEMVNLAGAVVKKWSAPIAGGTNTITIQTGDIAAGIYHIQATAADARTIFRLVKQ